MKNFLTILSAILFFFYIQSYTFAAELSADIPEISNREVNAHLNKIKTKRIIIANALLLDNAQKEKALKIYSDVVEKEALLVSQLEKEKQIMKELYKQENNRAERRNQRRIIYNLQKAIADVENQVDKDFRKILNHDQKVKFNRLRKEIVIYDF